VLDLDALMAGDLNIAEEPQRTCRMCPNMLKLGEDFPMTEDSEEVWSLPPGCDCISGILLRALISLWGVAVGLLL
jgi:hypothetical protein